MSTQLRVVVLVVVVLVVLTLAGSYVLHLRHAEAAAPAETGIAATLDAKLVLAQPHLVFRSTAPGPDYGRLAVAPLERPDAARALLDSSCERVYATAGSGVCVAAKRGLVPTYTVTTLNSDLRPVSSAPLTGLPSRARISRDGSLVATTTFVTGHSYAQSSFSTNTLVRRNGRVLGNLEQFTTFVDGRHLAASNRNYWGVTFAGDDDTFYATAASGAKTWLVRGSLAKRRMDSIRSDAECPSLSPDGTKVAYKKRLGSKQPGQWRLAVLDLGTGKETLLAEPRSVDDQVEWLDDDEVLYGLPRSGAESAISDVWSVRADGTGEARTVLPEAASPAVVTG